MKTLIVVLIVLGAVILAVKFVLPNERTVTRKVVINANQERIFNAVTDLSAQKWRSQLTELQILESTPGQEVWREKGQDGQSLTFRTRTKIYPSRFEIEIVENPHFSGYWIGVFTPVADGKTEIEFSEHVILRGIIPKLISYLFFRIDDVVDDYISDLRNATEEL